MSAICQVASAILADGQIGSQCHALAPSNCPVLVRACRRNGSGGRGEGLTRTITTRFALPSSAAKFGRSRKFSRSIRGRLPGQVAGVEIERKAGRWIYEFRVVDGKGRLFEVYVDARTGEIDRIKEK